MNERPNGQTGPNPQPGTQSWGQPTPPTGAQTGAGAARPVGPGAPQSGQWPQTPPSGQWPQTAPSGQWPQTPPPAQWPQTPPPAQWPQSPPAGQSPVGAVPPPQARPGPSPSRSGHEPWPSEGGRALRVDRGPGAASLVVGGVLILTGIWLLIREFAPELEPSRFWPVAIVGLGLVLLFVSLAGRARGRGASR